jgi:hypothetical protein
VYYSFQYSGGSRKPTNQTLEKFMLFLVISGKEIPLYQALKDGLALRESSTSDGTYVTGHQVVKLFVAEQGFGLRRRFHSFYLSLLQPPAPVVQIRPFSLGASPYEFKARCRFLERDQVLDLLDPESTSYLFFQKQEFLPLDLLRAMIRVDKSELKKNIRHLEINEKKGEVA